MKPSDRPPKTRLRPPIRLSFRSSSPHSMSATTSPRCFGGWSALRGVNWEVIFVDDNSPDGTWDVVRGLARQDSRVRCVRRIGRRGLSGACIEGILASSAPFAAVIDADLQHDETQLPA